MEKLVDSKNCILLYCIPGVHLKKVKLTRNTNMRRSDKRGLRGNETAVQKGGAGMMGDKALHRAGGGQPRGKWMRAVRERSTGVRAFVLPGCR